MKRKRRGLGHVALPAMRTGLAAGIVEKTPALAVGAMAKAIKVFCESNPTHAAKISIMFYNDALFERHLRNYL